MTPNTWLSQIVTLEDKPVVRRTRVGVGFDIGGGLIRSHFAGHRVHYLDGGLWKPITLQHDNGQFEGSLFSWQGGQVFYNGSPLFHPRAVFLDGTRHNLTFAREENIYRADLPFGWYEVVFTEGGVKELLTIPEPINGLIAFDVPHQGKPEGLHKVDRHIVGTQNYAETFQITDTMQFPLEIDPDYSADTADDYAYGLNATYSTARSTAYGIGGASSNSVLVGQRPTGGNYRVARAGLKFDTSGIPDGDTVSDAVCKLVCISDSSGVDFDVTIVKQDWSAQDPITSGNKETFYDNCLAATSDAVWRNTSGMSLNTQYASPSLDTSRISKTGYTYYGLISSRDVSNTAPGGSDEDIQIASANHATSGYRPVLTVTHAAGASRQNRLLTLGVG